MQRLMDRLLNYRDKALEADPQHTGMPEDFKTYCRISWLPAHIGKPFYRNQAQAHIETLATRIANLQCQIEEQAGGLLDERDRLIQQRLWLRNELDAAGVG